MIDLDRSDPRFIRIIEGQRKILAALSDKDYTVEEVISSLSSALLNIVISEIKAEDSPLTIKQARSLLDGLSPALDKTLEDIEKHGMTKNKPKVFDISKWRK